ncbi:unnamed protein product [Linum trigynum]|uniref:Uncharacterized protein n=1 Tax=Linum trigynum TaxID=586398 RepID=A0AAV2DVB9_9ROSI
MSKLSDQLKTLNGPSELRVSNGTTFQIGGLVKDLSKLTLSISLCSAGVLLVEYMKDLFELIVIGPCGAGLHLTLVVVIVFDKILLHARVL